MAPARRTTPDVQAFASALVPGRFDASDATWIKHIARAAADSLVLDDGTVVPVTQIILTETTDRNLPDVACPDGWTWIRKWKPPGASNVSMLLRDDRWEVHPSGAYVALATDDPVWTTKGRLRPPHYALVAPLVDLAYEGQSVLLAGEHWPLRNTARRRQAYDEAVANAEAVWGPGREALGPTAVRLWACDWNLSVVAKAGRAAWQAAFGAFTPSWAAGLPGWRRLIDWQAGGKGLTHLKTEWHQRSSADQFDHPWSVTAWAYTVPVVAPDPIQPVCGQIITCTRRAGHEPTAHRAPSEGVTA